jgi:effector-binding domain-containing protein
VFEKASRVAYWAVVKDVTGSIYDTARFLSDFQNDFAQQKLDVFLERFEPRAILVLAHDPRGAPASTMAVGLTVAGPLAVQKPLRLYHVQFESAVTYKHTGPYEELGRVFDEMQAFQSDSKLRWPCILHPLNDPRRVPPNEIETELVVALAPAQLASDEQHRIDIAVQDSKPFAQQVVSQTFHGSMDDMDQFLKEFMGSINAQNLGERLAGAKPVPLAILHDDPEENKEIRLELTFPVIPNTAAGTPLQVRSISLSSAASYMHTGSFERLGSVHGALVERAIQVGRGKAGERLGWPVVLRLLTDPKKVSSDAELRTELIVPLPAASTT